MAICKYFLRGTCRFGENCKNEHSYNENATSILRKKPDVDQNVIIKAVSNDMDKAEKGNQWPLSCYGPFPNKPCFPGFEDKSFEEIRLGIYEATKNGTIVQYKQQLNLLLQEARMKMRSLQNPTPEAINVLKELFSSVQEAQNSTQSPFLNSSNSAAFNNPSAVNHTASIFVAPSTSAQSIFGGQNSQNPTTAGNFTFALPENNIFGGANQNNQTGHNPGALLIQQTQSGAFSGSGSIFGGFVSEPQKNFGTVFQNQNQTPGNPPGFNNQGIFAGQTAPQPFGRLLGAQQVQPGPGSPFGGGAQPGGNPAGFFSPTSGHIGASPMTSAHQVNSAAPFAPGVSPIGLGTAPVNSAPLFPPGSSSTGQTAEKNVFQQQNNQANNLFANKSPFENSSVFGGANVVGSPANVFGGVQQSNSPFGGRNAEFKPTKQDDRTVYSQLEELAESDRKFFEAADFEFGKIPEKPPTLQMCS